MRSDNFDITVASLPDREELVAEIYYNHDQWVEISQEHEQLIVQFYAPLNTNCWEFSFDQALETLKQAKKKLLKLGGKR
jgi:hypothetical protein